MTEKSVMEKAERLGFRLVKHMYGGYALVDKNNMVVAPDGSWTGISLEEANGWLNDYFRA